MSTDAKAFDQLGGGWLLIPDPPDPPRVFVTLADLVEASECPWWYLRVDSKGRPYLAGYRLPR